MVRCMPQDILLNLDTEFRQFLLEPNAMRSLFILVLSIFLAYWLSNIIAKIIIRVAQLISLRADSSSDENKIIQLRRVETYLSVTVAIVRAMIVAVVAYLAWRTLSPASNPSAAAIGASALFIVLAGSTLGPLLRDITSGATMVIERWFNVGDFIRVEPFIDLGGVVERMTLRSTRLRSLNGEVIWLHNQHIHGVRVTPRGVRTIAVDIFVNNQERGTDLIEKVVDTIPIGTMTVTHRLKVSQPEKWGENLWRITVTGQTPPGREWLIENYFVETIEEMDESSRKKSVIMRKPLVRFADPAAERSFKRAVRIAKQE